MLFENVQCIPKIFFAVLYSSTLSCSSPAIFRIKSVRSASWQSFLCLEPGEEAANATAARGKRELPESRRKQHNTASFASVCAKTHDTAGFYCQVLKGEEETDVRWGKILDQNLATLRANHSELTS